MCSRLSQGQPRIIICTNLLWHQRILLVPASQCLHTKTTGYVTVGVVFKMGVMAILGMQPGHLGHIFILYLLKRIFI